MKIFIVAAAAWAAGALLGYFVARLAYKHLRKRLRTLRQERKPPKKKMGTMDRILVLEAVFLVAYTVADLVVTLTVAPLVADVYIVSYLAQPA